MNELDQSYYIRRAAEERARAANADRPETRRAHAELAERYAELLAEPITTVQPLVS